MTCIAILLLKAEEVEKQKFKSTIYTEKLGQL